MRTDCSADMFEFEAVESRRVEAAFGGGTMTSDAGALLLSRVDRRLGLLKRFAACFVDGRSPGTVVRVSVRRVRIAMASSYPRQRKWALGYAALGVPR